MRIRKRLVTYAAAAGRMLDVRVATLPTVEGESIVMRLLDKSKKAPTLVELGLSEEMQGKLAEIIRRPTGALLVTGVFASALAFLVQTWAQRRTSATRTALAFAMEPVFTAFFGYTLAGDRIGALGWGGAVLIMAGIVLAEPAAARALSAAVSRRGSRRRFRSTRSQAPRDPLG